MRETKAEKKVKKAFATFFDENWAHPEKKEAREARERGENPKRGRKKKVEKEKKFDFLWHLINITKVSPVIAQDWMQVRKEKRAVNTQTAFNSLYNELEKITEKFGITNNDAITICVIRSWMGCRASYFENLNFADYGITATKQQDNIHQNTNTNNPYYGRNQQRHPEAFVRTFTEKDQQSQVF